ncbi:MAG: hypothetical protein Fur0016_05610 [Anaerolineales bacterium]
MICPKCRATLTKKYYKGMMEVDYCPHCRGMWLDFHELDQLEDVAFDQDHYKGSLIHRECQVECPCPVCEAPMLEFQYRLYDLKLDVCSQKHGFWLDSGEDEHVLEVMRRRAGEIRRKTEAEAEWKRVLKGLHAFFKEGM